MGKIKVNVKGSTSNPVTEAPTHASTPSTASFHEPSRTTPSYGYPPQYYPEEPYDNIRQRSNMPQHARPKQSPHPGYPYHHPSDYYQQQEHPFASRGGYAQDPFQQFFAPQQQYQRRQPQPSRRQTQPQPMNPPNRPPSHTSKQNSVNESNVQSNENEAVPIPNRNEGGLLQESGKQYSMASTQTFTKLDTIKAKYNDLLSRVNQIEKDTNQDETESLNKSKNLLAQISGDIDRLQFTGLDAIDTSVLHTGKDEARTKRKKLNHDIEELQQHVQELHKIYGEMGSRMTQHERDTNQASSSNSDEDSSSETYGDTSEGPQLPSTEDSAPVEATDDSQETTISDEGNPLSTFEAIDIDSKRVDDQQESEKENQTSTSANEANEEDSPVVSGESEIEVEDAQVEASSEPAADVKPPVEEEKEEEEPEAQTLNNSEENPMDTVDMTEWVIENSPNQTTDDDECTTLRRQLQEKDALINQLRAELLAKEQFIQQLQNSSSSSPSS